ncbi:MAG: type IV pilus twitching motility protein PilT [Proteobacteria bacterium]|nr:MAG: type IV pilus twitching motility protein PilT [Pseudomonadota bacterium]
MSNQAPAPSAKPVIHFGAFIPGETIERGTTVFALDTVLQDMIKRKASDLHLTQGEKMCMRIDGEIVRTGTTNLTEAEMKEYLLAIMPPRNMKEFSEVSDTDFAYEVPGLARFRVNIFRDRMGVGAVLRQIPEKILSADDLGLPPAVRRFCELSKGLVVVTGPTGSGKSTTLAGMVDLINETRHEHILTIEDPIEFVHKQKNCLINQREVHKHTQSFSRALRAALREDPDIILIGEMRDLETVEIAIETAETGHLVFGTLHTNTAISTVDRLIDQFPADQQSQIRVMLAESLKGVVAQTLIRKKGGGRVAALEILVVDKAVASLIREGNTHMMGNHMQTQKAKGNIMLNESLINLVVKGIVDAKDAYMKAVEKEAFLTMLQSKGIALEVQKAS